MTRLAATLGTDVRVQFRNGFYLAIRGVVRDERQLARLGLSGDPHIAGTDRRPLRCEMRTDLAGLNGSAADSP